MSSKIHKRGGVTPLLDPGGKDARFALYLDLPGFFSNPQSCTPLIFVTARKRMSILKNMRKITIFHSVIGSFYSEISIFNNKNQLQKFQRNTSILKC